MQELNVCWLCICTCTFCVARRCYAPVNQLERRNAQFPAAAVLAQYRISRRWKHAPLHLENESSERKQTKRGAQVKRRKFAQAHAPDGENLFLFRRSLRRESERRAKSTPFFPCRVLAEISLAPTHTLALSLARSHSQLHGPIHPSPPSTRPPLVSEIMSTRTQIHIHSLHAFAGTQRWRKRERHTQRGKTAPLQIHSQLTTDPALECVPLGSSKFKEHSLLSAALHNSIIYIRKF